MSDQTSNENLVAYLDGELSASQSREVEQRLAGDPRVRKEVDYLLRTWDLLDELDEVTASEGFTNNTLTRIQVAESSQLKSSASSGVIRAWLPTAVTCLAIVVAVTFGFLSTHLSLDDDRQFTDAQHEVLRNLPLLEKLHLYEDVDVEFAELLNESGLLDE